MQRPAEISCDTVRDRLDPLLDGDLDRHEEGRIEDHLDHCPACREELRLAQSLRTALRNGMPTLSCPPEVTAEVLRIARSEAATPATETPTGASGAGRAAGAASPRRWLAGLLAPLHPGWSTATAWAAVAALLLLVVALPFVIRQVAAPEGIDRGGEALRAERPGPERDEAPSTGPRAASAGAPHAPGTGYTAEQVARAEREARMVLAAVAQVSRGAGRTIQDQIIEEALVRPARRAVASLDVDGQEAGRAGRQP